MSDKTLSKKRIEWRELFWVGGSEVAATAAVVLAVPFIISRLVAIYRAHA